MKKNKIIQIRVNDQEEQYINLKMKENNYKNRSEYILNSCITPLKHDKKRSLQMIYEVNKIGVNLNQALRKMHSLNFISQDLVEEIQNANNNLEEILKIYGAL